VATHKQTTHAYVCDADTTHAHMHTIKALGQDSGWRSWVSCRSPPHAPAPPKRLALLLEVPWKRRKWHMLSQKANDISALIKVIMQHLQAIFAHKILKLCNTNYDEIVSRYLVPKWPFPWFIAWKTGDLKGRTLCNTKSQAFAVAKGFNIYLPPRTLHSNIR
jgi:hypothetical protein